MPQGRDEVVDRDRGHRLVARGPAGPEFERHARHRLLVGDLDDADEVVLADRRPLRLHRRAELLDLLVDLADALRVVLDRLHALGCERGEHDPGRHGDSSRVGLAVALPRRSIRSFCPRAVFGDHRIRSSLVLAALAAAAAALPATARAAAWTAAPA